MGDTIKNYEFGLGGVNIVTDPLKLAPNEATQLQNAEVRQDADAAGAAALVMRGGLAALNGSAMSGSVLGGIGWPLKTTYSRTLYAARGTEDSNTFRTSTNGTSWSDSSSASAAAAIDKYTDQGNERDARRMVSFRTFLLYPGNGYTQDTDNPIVVLWDGTTAVTVTGIPKGPSGVTNPPFAVVDMLVAEGFLYLAIHEPDGATEENGRVLRLSLDTGTLRQVGNSFGGTSPEISGGHPSCMTFYKGQLFVGLNGNNTTDGVGKIVRCFPGVDTSWTTDVSNLSGHVSSLVVFKGKVYAGTHSSVSSAEKIYERSPTAGTWAAVFTGVGAAGTGHCAHGIVYSSALYFAQYHSTAPTIHIKRSTDGTSWATDRDVDTTDSGVAGNLPGGACVGPNSDLFYVFRSTTTTATDGFILRRASGSWTKVDTDNLLGPINVLVQRSA
jgi:hypothetical protein